MCISVGLFVQNPRNAWRENVRGGSGRIVWQHWINLQF